MSLGKSRGEIGKWVVIAAINLLAIAGLMIHGWTTMYPHMQDDILFTSTSLILLVTGSFLLVVGVFLSLGSENVSEEYTVVEIAAMRTKVTITELQRETNLPRETIEEILRDALLNQWLSGYLDDEEFVRDVSVSPWKADMAWVNDDD